MQVERTTALKYWARSRAFNKRALLLASTVFYLQLGKFCKSDIYELLLKTTVAQKLRLQVKDEKMDKMIMSREKGKMMEKRGGR